MRIDKKVWQYEAKDNETYTVEWSRFHDAWIVVRTSDSFNSPLGTFDHCLNVIKTQYLQDKIF
jgi:hypothetical protein